MVVAVVVCDWSWLGVVVVRCRVLWGWRRRQALLRRRRAAGPHPHPITPPPNQPFLTQPSQPNHHNQQDNLIHGRFLAELTREFFTDLEASK